MQSKVVALCLFIAILFTVLLTVNNPLQQVRQSSTEPRFTEGQQQQATDAVKSSVIFFPIFVHSLIE